MRDSLATDNNLSKNGFMEISRTDGQIRTDALEMLPDMEEYMVEDPGLRAPENCTDVYFFGAPGTGKTTLLMGLTGAVDEEYTLDMMSCGGNYARVLQEYVAAGITPCPTFKSFVTVINGEVNRQDKKGNIVNHPINLVEMSGEEFVLKIAGNKDNITLADMGTGATNLLKNNNRKIFFIIVDPTKPRVKVGCRVEMRDGEGNLTGYDIRMKYVSQFDFISTLVGLFNQPENADIMQRVDAIHFVVTKADTLGDTDSERMSRAKELLYDTYMGPVEILKNYCHTKHINNNTGNRPSVFTFSIGEFHEGGVFSYDKTDTLKLVDAISLNIRKKSWWRSLFGL